MVVTIPRIPYFSAFRFLLLLTGGLLVAAAVADGPLIAADKEPYETVTYKSKDGVEITADLYLNSGKKKKKRAIIVLCHMARSSRGEYRSIAPRLVKQGFHCLAVDLRAGSGTNTAAGGIPNETAADAKEKGKSREYNDAMIDLVATVNWVRKKGFKGNLILAGSSYSSSLVLVYAGDHEKKIQGVISFSPNEYLSGVSVKKAAAAIRKIPVYVTCADQTEDSGAKTLFDAVPSKAKVYYLPEKGLHGSKTLGGGVPEKFREKNWASLLEFLGHYQKKRG